MMNLIRADLYRLFRGKSLYVMLVLLIGFIVLQTLVPGGIFDVEVSSSSSSSSAALANLELDVPALSGRQAPGAMLAGADQLLYFMLMVINVVAMTDFSTGAVRNVLANGTSRTTYYFAKLLLCFTFCAVLHALSIVVAVITATLHVGFGEFLGQPTLWGILRAYGAQTLMLCAATAVGVALAFTVKRGVALNAWYLVFFLVVPMVVYMVGQIVPSMIRFFEYDYVINLRSLAQLANREPMPGNELLRCAAITLALLVGSTGLGLRHFRRCEVR